MEECGKEKKECVVDVKDSGGDVKTTPEIDVLQIQRSIEQKIHPAVSRETSHHGTATIHRVCAKLRAGDENTYIPKLVSIGPYHHGKKELEEMQEVKYKYLDDLIKRNSENSLLPKYIESVKEKAEEAKVKYLEPENLKLQEFAMMMVVDGCFLLEFLLKSYLNDRKEQMNIVKTNMPTLMNDLLLVENQIPFFILEELFKVYKQQNKKQNNKNDDSFTIEVLALSCFSPGDCLDAQVAAEAFKKENKSFHHLLHLYHSSLNPHQDRSWKEVLEFGRIVDQMFSSNESEEATWCSIFRSILIFILVFFTLIIILIPKGLLFVITEIIALTLSKLCELINLLILLPLNVYLQFMKFVATGRIGGKGQWTSGIPNARYLRDTGIKFRKKDTVHFLDVTCSGRTINIPVLYMQDTVIIHYKNLLALEHSSENDGYEFTKFAKFMDYLIDTEDDVAILRECGIIGNRLGEDKMVANFFNNLLRGIHIKDEEVPMFQFVKNYYTNGYYKVRFFQWRKKLVPEYFSNPWAVPSMIAAFILLVLTVIQTFYTVYPYYHHRDS